MTTLSARIFELFRNLKTDAVPRAPRPENPETNGETPEHVTEQAENTDSSSEPEEIVIEPDDDPKDEKKSKTKKSFFKPNKKKDDFGFPKPGKNPSRDSGNNVNTQATGNVINIVNSKDVHCGNVFHFGPPNKNFKEPESSEERIDKCNLITLLMEAKIKPTHEYIDYISKNLGKNWHSFFKTLGYSKGRIETVEIDEARNGVSEARYKLLLDWIRNDEDGTLGRLATLLWEHGERHIVKELAVIYKKNKK